jgi:MFS family permease
VRPPSLIPLLSLYAFCSTFSIGAFPALLPEIGTAAGLADWQIGLVAGLLGFARMVADVPVGLVITHHLRRTLIVAPFVLALGAICLAGGESFALLAVGRGLMGVGHALTVVSGLTALLRFAPAGAMGSALTAFEMSAMIGVLGGTAFLRLLPSWLPWNVALLVGCSPQLLTFAVLPRLVTAIPRDPDASARPIVARAEGHRSHSAPVTAGAVLAFAAGVVSAVTYSTLEQFVIPFRGQREFALDRHGIAGLLMIVQAIDVVCLLPLGRLVDRVGVGLVLGPTLIAHAVGAISIALGGFAFVVAGCVLYGIGLAGWPLPLGLLRGETPPGQIGWRTAVYRVGVDGGIFLGPLLSGVLSGHATGIVPVTCAGALLVIGALIAVRR